MSKKEEKQVPETASVAPETKNKPKMVEFKYQRYDLNNLTKEQREYLSKFPESQLGFKI